MAVTSAIAALLLAMPRPSAAAVICQQDCTGGTCAQASCGKAPSGGFSHCAGGLLAWDGAVYSSWCLAWGQPLAPSRLPIQAVDPATGAAPNAAIPQPEAMTAAVRSANPWVATLLAALQETRWASGPVQGLVHDSHVDTTMTTNHSAAIHFAGQAQRTAAGGLQIDIRVAGDAEQLSHLARQAAASSPAAVAPREIHGSVTADGLHGTLQVNAADGRQQTIQW